LFLYCGYPQPPQNVPLTVVEGLVLGAICAYGVRSALNPDILAFQNAKNPQ